MKVIRRNDQPHNQERYPLTPSGQRPSHGTYFFYEQSTGVSPFHVEAGPDGQFPVEEAAGLLVMHCMVRGGQSPRDYAVMVEAAPESPERPNRESRKTATSGAFGGPLGQVDSPGTGSVRRRHVKSSQQRDRRFAEPFRAHRKVPRLAAADEVPRAWPDAAGA